MFESKKGGDRGRILSNKGQVTVFIIIALIIVVLVVLFFVFRGKIIKSTIPKELEPVYSYYLSCISYETKSGAGLLGQGAGYINGPDFSPGSSYMPFSSHLAFMGNGVPYWYTITGNGRVIENVPTKTMMQEELNDFIKEGLKECDFKDFRDKGFEVTLGNPDISTDIQDIDIISKVKQDITIKFGDKTFIGKSHTVDTKSSLGRFYSLSKKIYEDNKKNMFLENYGVDILRLYAPVDGTEISCSPKIWPVNQVRENLTSALSANIPEIKIKGDYYKLASKENQYFVRDLGEKTPVAVNFMYQKDWPMKIDVNPNEDGILRADPIGLQEGLGMLGFCYVPYHFVYDFYFPVLIQVYSQDEMFQFPVVVVIDKNQPRKALNGSSEPAYDNELCTNKLTMMTVNTYDNSLLPVKANIKYKCFDNVCNIGDTEITNDAATLSKEFPQCGNGFVIASAEGYETKKEVVSTIVEGSVDLILSKKYKLDLEVRNKLSPIEGKAVVTFTKENGTSTTVSYPEMKEIELSEGQYVVKAYVYKNTSIYLKGSTSQKCIDVPKGGVLGMFGATEQKCFNMDIPDQTIDMAISGGGTQNHYISESELAESKTLVIEPDSFVTPKDVVTLQNNFNSIETSHINIFFEK